MLEKNGEVWHKNLRKLPEKFAKQEESYISRLEIYIFRLEIYISRLEIHILRLEIELLTAFGKVFVCFGKFFARDKKDDPATERQIYFIRLRRYTEIVDEDILPGQSQYN